MSSQARNLRLLQWFSDSSQSPGVWLHINIAVLMLAPVATILALTRVDRVDDSSRALGLVLVFSAFLSIGLLIRGVTLVRLPFSFTLLVLLNTLAGLPGNLLTQTDVTGGLLFLGALVVRNYICFFSVPMASAGRGVRIERVVLWWTFVACAAVALASYYMSVVQGVALTLQDTDYSTESTGWLNANATGVYCAFAMLMGLVAKFIPLIIRLPVSLIALYCLIVSQSRTSVLALIAGGFTYLIIKGVRRVGVTIIATVTIFGIASASSDYLLSQFQNVPRLESLVKKFQSADPRTNSEETTRMDVIRAGLEIWSKSPVVGLGYAAPDTRFENGYLSLACETGVLGLGVYVLFLGLVSTRTARLLRTQADSHTREIGTYLACVTVFILVHSMGERTHVFTLAFPGANLWAILSVLAYRAQVQPRIQTRQRTVSVYSASASSVAVR